MKTSSRPAYELDAVNLRAIAVGVVGLGLLTVFSVLGPRWLLRRFAAESPESRAHALAAEGELPPAPRLQANVREDIDAHRRSEEHILTSYGWIDRDAQVVRIPIEQALELTLERGLPSRPAPPPSRERP